LVNIVHRSLQTRYDDVVKTLNRARVLPMSVFRGRLKAFLFTRSSHDSLPQLL